MRRALLVALVAWGCSEPSPAEPTGCHTGEVACQERTAFLFTTDTAKIERFGQGKGYFLYRGPYLDLDPEGNVVTFYYAAWIDCQGLCQ